MKRLERCPICCSKSEGAKVVLDTTETITGAVVRSTLVECAKCSHVFLNPQPTWEELKSFYSENYTCYSTSTQGETLSEKQVKDALVTPKEISHVPVIPGGRLLDIGCGTGELIRAMTAVGVEAEGVEPIHLAAETARRLGRRVFCGTLEDAQYPDDWFDAISMIHVLEHVPEPGRLLQLCLRILKPRGSITIAVPNFDSSVFRLVRNYWVGLQLPTHLHHFRTHSLKHLVVGSGLKVEASFTESLVPFVERELVNWIRQRFYIPARLLLKTRVLRPFASHMAARGNATGYGEAIVVRARKESGGEGLRRFPSDRFITNKAQHGAVDHA